MVFVGNALTDEELSEAYATLDTPAYYKATRADTRRKLANAANELAALGASTHSKILDIGAGLGQFTLYLSELGYTSIAAHELPGSDLSEARQSGIEIYQDYDWSSLPSAEFNMVTMLDVAEHVREPRRSLQQCFRVLRPGGTLYLHTPFVTGLDQLMHVVAAAPGIGGLGRIWQRGRTSIFHLQNYTETALREMLDGAGFINIRIKRRNELSWPVERYVEVFLCEKQHLPKALAPLLTPLVYPLLTTALFNANKGVAHATKPL
jgi:2-polyprenyl-3-methyl-5-hydroxy-6-metoxy-1,4-benzoquinol methylase